MMRHVIATQVRLTLRGWGFWVVGAGLSVLSIPLLKNRSQLDLMAEIAAIAFLLLLGQMLLVTVAAQTERTEGTDELLEAMPYQPLPWMLGRFLAQYVLWLAQSIWLWVVAAGVLVASGKTLDTSLLASQWLVVAPVTLAASTAIAMALGTLIRQRFAAMGLVVLVAWVGALGPETLEVLRPWWALSALQIFPADDQFPLTGLGFFPNGLLVALNRVLFFGLALALLSFLVWRIGKRRGFPLMAMGLAALLFGLTATAGLAGSSVVWAERHRAYKAEREAAAPGVADRNHEVPVRTDHYELQVTFDPEQHHLAAEGSFEVRNVSDKTLTRIPLSLRSTLSVTAVKGENGETVRYERTGDALSLYVKLEPGEVRRFSLTWEGVIWHWRVGYKVQLGPHVARESIFLPANYGWYPLPGEWELAAQAGHCWSHNCHQVIDDPFPSHQPAAFTLEVNGTSLNIVTNANERVTGAYLIGTPYDTVRVGPIEITASPDWSNAVQQAPALAEEAEFYQHLLPQKEAIIRAVELPGALFFGQGRNTANPSVAPLTLFGNHRGWALPHSHSPVSTLWWQTAVHSLDWYRMGQAFHAYSERLRGVEMQMYSQDAPTFFQVLVAVEETKGQETAIAILREMHAQRSNPDTTATSFKELVRQLSGDEERVRTALDRIIERPQW